MVPVSTIGTVGPQDGNDAAAALYAKGMELARLDKFEEAVSLFNQAIKVRTDYPEAHYNLGNAYFVLMQYKKAVDS